MAKSGNYAKCNVPQKLYGVESGKQGVFQRPVFVAQSLDLQGMIRVDVEHDKLPFDE